MNFIKYSIEKPVTVIVGVILIVLFGAIGLRGMPYQLAPDVTEPEIAVSTIWPGSTPYEIERDIIEEQEEALKGIPGLLQMESSSFNNRGTITLRFKIGTEINDALLRVSNKLNEVSSYPENVEKPVINATGSATSPVIWMILRTAPDNPNHVMTYKTFFLDEVKQHLERVDGVADLFIGGGVEKEMHITIDPTRLASYGFGLDEIIRTLRAENINLSAGVMGVGRRDYRIRTLAEFKSPEDIERVVLRSTGERRVFLSDVATVGFGYSKRTTAMLHNAKPGMAIGVKPEPGTNILDLTDRVERVVEELNADKLKREGIYFDWVYDQRSYISGAIGLIKTDILIGGALAVVVLLIFLRSITATFIISTAIPISVLGTFIFMYAFGRNLNVVSLAGISFAVGILVDNAIVVLENIDRHLKMGKTPAQAAYDGTHEVWGAILNTTVSTVAVFLPVIFLQAEAGQLFKDIAIAVCFAVGLSLFVSVSVIPMLSGRLFKKVVDDEATKGRITAFGEKASAFIMRLVNIAVKEKRACVITVLSFTILSVFLIYALLPKAEYLPQGNRNLIINILIPPPGLSYEEKNDIGEKLFAASKPYLGKDEVDGVPGVKNMFYVGTESIMLAGAISSKEDRASELIPVYKRIVNTIPGVFGITNQAGIFQTRLGRGRTIELEIKGDDLSEVNKTAGMFFGMIKKELPGAQVRPRPSIETLYPEIRFIPDRDRLKALGMSAYDFGIAVDVLMDGRRIGDFKAEGKKKIDLVLRAQEEEVSTPEALYSQLLVTSGGKLVPVSTLATLERGVGITEIRHLERRRSVSLQITPSETMAISEAMELIEEKVVGPATARGLLSGVEVLQSGVADKLTETIKALQWNFILAAFIMYLIMAALFENFLYPLILMLTIPLGAAGGFVGLKVVNLISSTPQPFDIVTMLGFIIAVGIVIDNATLIVYQALNNMRNYGMAPRDAVIESTRTRLRPIYMSTATSIFGMLPLVIVPGPGSELYRGLGSVVLGGLAFSTVLTVFVIPALLILFLRPEKQPA